MNHNDHVMLLREGVTTRGDGGEPPVWADVGSGGGAFTLALADLLGDGATIHSVDRDRGALREQARAMRANFPATIVEYHQADFTRPLDVPALDGIVIANALHFVRDCEKLAIVRGLRAHLRPAGRLILVEYGTDRGNHWVPHPLTFPAWAALATAAGFATTRSLATVPSRFLGSIYSSVSE